MHFQCKELASLAYLIKHPNAQNPRLAKFLLLDLQVIISTISTYYYVEEYSVCFMIVWVFFYKGGQCYPNMKSIC
jgi:hypothetical protein